METSLHLHTPVNIFNIMRIFTGKLYQQIIPLPITLGVFIITLMFGVATVTVIVSSGSAFAQSDNDTGIKEYQFVTKWGSMGTEPGQFDGQNNVAGTGEFVYVPDYNNQRIQKFTNDGQLVKTWGGTYDEADGEFKNPHGVALDSEGNVYVSERSGLRIQKFDSDGNFITKWGSEGTGNGQFLHLHDIAVGPSGDSSSNSNQSADGTLSFSNNGNASQSTNNEFVYVTDNEIFNVQKFTLDGDFVTSWGSEGESDGQFASLESLDVDSQGNVYVADFGNNRIQKFTSDGEFISTWGFEGSEQGQFDGPSGLAVDNEDNIYVTENDNHRIQEFTSEGEFLASWGSEGTEDGQFNRPEGIDVDPSGRVIVADTGNNRIQIFR
jgi:tripartite motif-containing protein 71